MHVPPDFGDRPFVLIPELIPRERIEYGVRVAVAIFGSRLRQSHPLAGLLREAQEATQSPDSHLRVSDSAHRVARWGIQLEQVADWAGFDAVVDRVVADKQGWIACFHEVTTAWFFAMVGCRGEFFVDVGHRIPDIKVISGDEVVVVECRRSESQTPAELPSYRIWQSACDQLVELMYRRIPAGFVRFFPTDVADVLDIQIVIEGMSQVIDEFLDLGRDTAAGRIVLESQGRQLRGSAILSATPDAMFEMITRDYRGLDVPDRLARLEPASLYLDLSIEEPYACRGIWSVAITHPRQQDAIEKQILRRIDEKTSQLNRFRASNHADCHRPGVIWVHHPCLTNFTRAQTVQLRSRVEGYLRSNPNGRFGGVNRVVISQSRLVIERQGHLHDEFRLIVVANPICSNDISSSFPLLGPAWYNDVISGSVRGVTMYGDGQRPTV